MTCKNWREEAIKKNHKRRDFDCGEQALNDFLHLNARQNHEKGIAKTYLALSNDEEKKVLGYYSLSAASIAYEKTPKVLNRGLARYDIPVFRLGRLAVDVSIQGQGLGGQLLLAAGRRSLLVASQVGGIALLIDAKNENIAGWYMAFGAVPLKDAPLSLLLPLKTIHAALHSEEKI